MDEKLKKDSTATVELKNEHLKDMPVDYLYHFGLKTDELEEKFGDVKFVCVGGSAHRMKQFAEYLIGELSDLVKTSEGLTDITEAAHRYSMFKVGPVLSVSHGIGMSSLSVMLDELFKLLHYANCTDVILIRIGTSGGIGVQPGTVVITNKAVNGLLKSEYEQIILGKKVIREALIDQKLAQEIKDVADREINGYEVVTGATMCAEDFYESQGRLDGPICNHTENDKKQYLQKLLNAGVRNIEMESVCVAAKCSLVKLKCAIVCVTLLNRLNGDQIDVAPQVYKQWELRPQQLVTRFIKRKLQTESH